MAMMFKNNPNHNPNAPSASALIQGTAGSFSTSFKEQELFDEIGQRPLGLAVALV